MWLAGLGVAVRGSHHLTNAQVTTNWINKRRAALGQVWWNGWVVRLDVTGWMIEVLMSVVC